MEIPVPVPHLSNRTRSRAVGDNRSGATSAEGGVADRSAQQHSRVVVDGCWLGSNPVAPTIRKHKSYQRDCLISPPTQNTGLKTEQHRQQLVSCRLRQFLVFFRPAAEPALLL